MNLGDQIVGVPHVYLAAISVGAVFMGANTYIGNGPNFMVKAIAEDSGYVMPSFFGYAARAVGVLTPLYLVVIYLLRTLY
jgi:Na+/H+ antiporter NhaD/arsenite permease-like protein